MVRNKREGKALEAGTCTDSDEAQTGWQLRQTRNQRQMKICREPHACTDSQAKTEKQRHGEWPEKK